MRYTSNSIDKVRDADIVKTIEAFYSLKKAGVNWTCNSPFTDEKTPSFVVSPAKQMFKCFSSGVGGDGIKFVMLHDKIEFVEAVEKIAGIHSIILDQEDITPELQRKIDQKTEMFGLLSKISRSFFNNRKKTDTSNWFHTF